MKQLPQGQYDFKETESKILEFWHSKPFFKPEYNPETKSVLSTEEMKKDFRQPFSIVCPPPNAYDRPHIGNLSGYAYQDAMGRFKRMRGYKVLLFPGKDHAGIDGESVFVREELDAKGLNKFAMDRDEFYKQVWNWQMNKKELIVKDEKSIGLSADFDRDLFTLDPNVVDIVLSTFIDMYKQGMIYKGVRIINWDPKSRSAIADNQCERKEREGALYYIKYPLKDSEEFLVVATTRPETMLGDTALVVNPTDERYAHLIGKLAILPLTNREIPIITSPRIEKEFGTGVLKLTPAHAPEDYEIMLEWNAAQAKNFKEFEAIGYVNVIDKDLKICGPENKYIGLKVNAAKTEMLEDLKAQGLLLKEEKITQNIQISERTGAVVEPMMSSQWFMDVDVVRKSVMDMVREEKVRIHPRYMEKKFFHWMENLRDWAISRSLWWGYRLPVWYRGELIEKINDKGYITAYVKTPEGKEIELELNNSDLMKVQVERPEGEGWIQDENVLDTWFSSGQWPYATLMSEDLMDTFYPTDVMETGYDILTKWVVNMMIMSQFKTGKIPFKDVYLHGLVKAADGQKMSKSKRNAIPFDDIVRDYGTDALRMVYFYQNKAGASYSLSHEKLKNFRNFNNKIWNASKFVMMNLEGLDKEVYFNELQTITSSEQITEFCKKHGLAVQEEDAEMLSQLSNVEKRFIDLFEKFRFGIINEELYHTFWHVFCDIYIEKSKSRVWKNKETGEYESETNSRKAAQVTLFYSLKSFLRMLHPFIPFITEEIWQHLIDDGSYEMPLMHKVSLSK